MTMVLGGVSMIAAALLTLRIKDAAMKRYYKSY